MAHIRLRRPKGGASRAKDAPRNVPTRLGAFQGHYMSKSNGSTLSRTSCKRCDAEGYYRGTCNAGDDVVRAYKQYKALIESHHIEKEETHATTLAVTDVKTDDVPDFD